MQKNLKMLSKRRRKANCNNNDDLGNNNFVNLNSSVQKYCIQHKNCPGTTDQVKVKKLRRKKNI